MPRISHLASLTLYNFVIEPAIVDTDMMVFILRHKGMRAQLALHGYHHYVGDSGHAMPHGPYPGGVGWVEEEMGIVMGSFQNRNANDVGDHSEDDITTKEGTESELDESPSRICPYEQHEEIMLELWMRRSKEGEGWDGGTPSNEYQAIGHNAQKYIVERRRRN
ncbi:hypothetical protein B0H14DRAFT_2588924 [Mycena olivaceomarginata]|nr:hypothetical protein B0H14DRAFT_2588924 [Mycena olivaceomarginata]